MRRPIGPYLGALLFALLQNFAVDLVDPDRFNTVIGAVFLAVIFLSPGGVLGLLERLLPAALPDFPRQSSRRGTNI